MKHIKSITVCIAAGVMAGLTACSDSDVYDVYGINSNLAYIDHAASNVSECLIYTTPVGMFGEVKVSIPVKMQYRVENAVTVGAVSDVSLVDKYNSKYNAEAESVPAAVADGIEVTAATIEKDATVAKENVVVTIPENLKVQLTQAEYVLPLRLVAQAGTEKRKVGSSEDFGVQYVHIKKQPTFVSLVDKSNTATISKLPSGIKGEVNAKFNVSMACAIGSDVKVSLTRDASLVGQYNKENGTNYKALPDNVASALAISNATIGAGKTTATINVTSGTADFSGLESDTYLLPLAFKATYSNGQDNPGDADVAYLLVKVSENLVADNPTELIGLEPTDISNWTCISADNFDPAKMSTDKWCPLEKKAVSSFTVDFGKVHNMTGFMQPYSYISYKGVEVQLSEDGEKWISVGDVSDKGTVNVTYIKKYYIFVAGVKARYMKMDIELSTTDTMWDYIHESWASDYLGVAWNVLFDD